MATIKLSDDTILENLIEDGMGWDTTSELDFEDIADKLCPVTITTGDKSQTFKHARLGSYGTIDVETDDGPVKHYFFSIIPISDEELAMTKGLDYIAECLLTDEQALNVPYFFDEWDPNGIKYEKDVSRVQYEGYLWKCILSHTSQISWNPKDANSLWVRIDDPAEEWPEWRQPEGAHDAYAKGAKVTHNEKHWTSDIDSNVWEPGVYGWTEETA